MFSESKWFNFGGSGFSSDLIGNSVWLDGSADTLAKTFSSGSAQTKVVISTWVQRNSFGSVQDIFSATGGTGGATRNNRFSFQADDTIDIQVETTALATIIYSTTRVFRDIGWYSVLVSIDQGQSASDQTRLYINGEQVDITATTGAGTFTAAMSSFGNAALHNVGSNGGAGTFLNGYQTQTTMLVGQSIQASDVAVGDFLDSFTYGDSGSQFGPKDNIAALASSAGGNSFCLEFGDASDLGNDSSSNNRDFTATSMAAANQSSNTPSLTFPLLNPLSAAFSTTLSNGNTTFSGTTGNGDDVNPGIIIPKTGKWVWQVTNTTDADLIYGVRNFSDMKAGDYSYTNLYGFYSHTGDLVQGASPSGSYLDAASGGDVYQIYYNAETRKMWVSDNGTIPNSGNPDGGSNEMFTIPDSGFDLCPTALVGGTSPNSTFDFGLNGVSLHANGGTFLPLTSANLPTPDAQGVDHFQAKLYTGSNASQNVTGFDFNPAFLWIKNRNVSGESHHLMDTVRGDNKFIHSNSSAIERTGSLNNGSNALAFITDGFSITNASGSADELNLDTRTYVSWAWLGSNSTSTNTNGSLNTTVTAANAGHFSIVGWTMSDPAGAKTLGHGLSAAPELIIVKNRTDAGTNWPVYSEAVGNTKYMYLSTTAAAATFNMWQNTSPTSTVFYVSSNNEASGSANDEMIAYCFRSVPGVCKVGTYTGNGSADGPYIDLGFKPAFFMAKQSSAVENWVMLDNQRPNYNPTGGYLFANLNNAEGGLGSEYVDFLSSGVKLRTTGASVNGSATFIYLAMADIAGGGTLPPVYGN
jgi:hypothetical protein